MSKFLQTKQVLDIAIRRLEARKKLAEAQIELSTIEIYDAMAELESLQDTRRRMRIEGRPIIAITLKAAKDRAR